MYSLFLHDIVVIISCRRGIKVYTVLCPSIHSFSTDEEVLVEIDSTRRRLNARIHSAGHLLDSALSNLGITDLVPSKVY